MKENIKYIKEKLTQIPNFIDTTSQTHYVIWGSMVEINEQLIKLITPNILTEKQVFKICMKVNMLLDNLSEISPGHIELKIIAYYSKLLLKLESYCIDNELFESCANIKNYTNVYYQKNPIK